jgi:hypothetical protein
LLPVWGDARGRPEIKKMKTGIYIISVSVSKQHARSSILIIKNDRRHNHKEKNYVFAGN